MSRDAKKIVIVSDGHSDWPRPGIGWMLAALMGVWMFAKRTDRTMAIDWRNTDYFCLNDKNAFDTVFAIGDELAGVPVIHGDDVATFDGADQNVIRCYHSREDALKFERILFGKLAKSDDTWGAVMRNEYVIYQETYGIIMDDDVARSRSLFPSKFMDSFVPLLKALAPSAPLKEKMRDVTSLWDPHHPTVGIHIRHGGGEFEDGGCFAPRVIDDTKFWKDLSQLLTPWVSQTNLFVATDAQVAIDRFLATYPEATHLRQWRAPSTPREVCPSEQGRLSPVSEDDHLLNAAADMCLLSRCDVVYVTRLSNIANMARGLRRSTTIQEVIPFKNGQRRRAACGAFHGLVREVITALSK